VQAIVAERGALTVSLLGMSFLKRLGSFQVADGQLTLRQ
jgi:predicted aspartyl protease